LPRKKHSPKAPKVYIAMIKDLPKKVAEGKVDENAKDAIANLVKYGFTLESLSDIWGISQQEAQDLIIDIFRENLTSREVSSVMKSAYKTLDLLGIPRKYIASKLGLSYDQVSYMFKKCGLTRRAILRQLS